MQELPPEVDLDVFAGQMPYRQRHRLDAGVSWSGFGTDARPVPADIRRDTVSGRLLASEVEVLFGRVLSRVPSAPSATMKWCPTLPQPHPSLQRSGAPC